MSRPSDYGISLLGLVGAVSFMLVSCGRAPGDYEQLRAENEQLKKELEVLRQPVNHLQKVPDATSMVELSLEKLWSQRFEETPLRAKMNLDQKTLRVTGSVETVRNRSLVVYGNATRFGRMRMEVKLEESYASSVQDGLAALERGIPVTLQGTFVYDSVWLTDATFVDSISGKKLSSSDLAALVEVSKSGASGEPKSSKTDGGDPNIRAIGKSGSE